MSKTLFFPHGYPHQGEIYKVYFSKKGQEIGKIRPSLVISNNSQNKFDQQIIVAPLTSETKAIASNYPFAVLVAFSKSNGLEKTSSILLNRVQTIDIKQRLRDYVGQVDIEVLKQCQDALKTVFGMDIDRVN